MFHVKHQDSIVNQCRRSRRSIEQIAATGELASDPVSRCHLIRPGMSQLAGRHSWSPPQTPNIYSGGHTTMFHVKHLGTGLFELSTIGHVTRRDRRISGNDTGWGQPCFT